MTSSFVFDPAEHARALFANEAEGNVYSRYSNPNTNELEEKVCRLEGADAAIAIASGMSAIFSSLGGAGTGRSCPGQPFIIWFFPPDSQQHSIQMGHRFSYADIGKPKNGRTSYRITLVYYLD
jgi:hypothetical protein